MTTQPVPARGTLTRSALAVALLLLAGLIVWVLLTRPSFGQPSPWLLAAALPVVAAGLLFVRRELGAAVAVLAALLAAILGLALSFCLGCALQLGPEAIAFFGLAAVIFALALFELRTLGVAWIGILIADIVVVLAFPGNPVVLAVGAVVAVVVVGLKFWRRRGSGGSASPSGTQEP